MSSAAEAKRSKPKSLHMQRRKGNPMHGQNMLATMMQGAKPKVDRSSNLGKYLHKKKR